MKDKVINWKKIDPPISSFTWKKILKKWKMLTLNEMLFKIMPEIPFNLDIFFLNWRPKPFNASKVLQVDTGQNKHLLSMPLYPLYVDLNKS